MTVWFESILLFTELNAQFKLADQLYRISTYSIHSHVTLNLHINMYIHRPEYVNYCALHVSPYKDIYMYMYTSYTQSARGTSMHCTRYSTTPIRPWVALLT